MKIQFFKWFTFMCPFITVGLFVPSLSISAPTIFTFDELKENKNILLNTHKINYTYILGKTKTLRFNHMEPSEAKKLVQLLQRELAIHKNVVLQAPSWEEKGKLASCKIKKLTLETPSSVSIGCLD